jgi:nitroreductase
VETWDAIRSRRNVRSYDQQAIAPQDLDRIVEAGRRAPSAGNQQAWDFIVCTDPEQLAQLAQLGPAAGHVAGSAATIALVAPTSDDAQLRDLIQFDLGQATMSVMLVAADLGIGSAHAGVGDQQLARRLLGFPDDRFCALLITLGTPPTGRSGRSSGPTGARSTTWCTAATGSCPTPWWWVPSGPETACIHAARADPNRQIRSLVLCVDLVGSRPIWPAHVECPSI